MMPVFKKIINLVTNFTSDTENASAATTKSSNVIEKNRGSSNFWSKKIDNLLYSNNILHDFIFATILVPSVTL